MQLLLVNLCITEALILLYYWNSFKSCQKFQKNIFILIVSCQNKKKLFYFFNKILSYFIAIIIISIKNRERFRVLLTRVLKDTVTL